MFLSSLHYSKGGRYRQMGDVRMKESQRTKICFGRGSMNSSYLIFATLDNLTHNQFTDEDAVAGLVLRKL